MSSFINNFSCAPRGPAQNHARSQAQALHQTQERVAFLDGPADRPKWPGPLRPMVASPPMPGAIAPPPSPKSWPASRRQPAVARDGQRLSKRVRFLNALFSPELASLSMPQFCAHQGWCIKALDTRSWDGCGNNKLHTASAAGNLAAIRFLLALPNPPDINRPNLFHQTNLHLATFHGHADAVHLLLMMGARISALDGEGNSALAVACRHQGSERLLFDLLRAGSDPNTENQLQQTPLHHAILTKNTDALAVLAKVRPRVDRFDCFGLTPLAALAVQGEPVSAAGWLCEEAGADPNLYNVDGESPVTLALRRRHVPLLTYFVQRGPVWLRGTEQNIGYFKKAIAEVAPHLLPQLRIVLDSDRPILCSAAFGTASTEHRYSAER